MESNKRWKENRDWLIPDYVTLESLPIERPMADAIDSDSGRFHPAITVESGYIIHPRTGPKWLIQATR